MRHYFWQSKPVLLQPQHRHDSPWMGGETAASCRSSSFIFKRWSLRMNVDFLTRPGCFVCSVNVVGPNLVTLQIKYLIAASCAVSLHNMVSYSFSCWFTHTVYKYVAHYMMHLKKHVILRSFLHPSPPPSTHFRSFFFCTAALVTCTYCSFCILFKLLIET